MTLLYRRSIQITVAGLTVTALRMAFQIARQIDGSQNRGMAIIYNLAPENEERVYERAESITIEAGYPETQALVFDGFVERVQRVRESLSRQTRCTLVDRMRKGSGGNALGGWTSLTLRGPEPVREIARLISADIGIPLGPLDAIPADATYTDWVYSGPGGAALTTLLATVPAVWFEDDGLIRINRPRPPTEPGDPQPDASHITVSPDTGLIDRPIETAEGAEAIMLLNPRIVIGSRLTLESDALSGDFKVTSLRHEGDNWHSRSFQTWVDLRPA